MVVVLRQPNFTRAQRRALRILRKIRSRQAYGLHNKFAPELRKYDLDVKRNQQGDTLLHYTWEVSYHCYLFDRQRLLKKIREFTRHMRSKKLFKPTDYIKAVLFTNNPGEHSFKEVPESKAIGTVFANNQTMMLNDVGKLLDKIELRYDIEEDLRFEVSRITLTVFRPNAANGAASAKRRTDMNQQFLIPGEYETQTNCYYVAKEMLKKQELFIDQYAEFLEGAAPRPNFTKQAKKQKHQSIASSSKAGEVRHQSFTDANDIQMDINHSNPKRQLILYDGQNRPIATFTPQNIKSEKTLKEMLARPPLNMQTSQNHYRPMIPWSEMPPEKRQRIESALQAQAPKSNELIKAQIIKKFPKLSETRNRKFVSWDIEASQNVGVGDAMHESEDGQKAYAVGLAFYTSEFPEAPKGSTAMDGDLMITYISFWGLDCLERFIEFLNVNGLYYLLHFD